MALTDTAIKNAKPREKPFNLWDEKGLYLRVQPNGGRWWRFKHRVAGKDKLLSLGTYPEVSLKAAREQRDAARKLPGAVLDREVVLKLFADGAVQLGLVGHEHAFLRDICVHNRRDVGRVGAIDDEAAHFAAALDKR